MMLSNGKVAKLPDKKLTDSEIVKALEDWIKNYDGSYVNFKTLGNTLDLINHLQCERNKYRRKVQNQREEINRLQTKNENYSKNNQQMTSDILKLYKELEQAKAENERLKEEICIQHKIVDERGKEILRHDRCIRTLHERLKTAKAEAYKEFAERLKKEQYLSIVDMVVSVTAIDNLLKELGGGNVVNTTD